MTSRRPPAFGSSSSCGRRGARRGWPICRAAGLDDAAISRFRLGYAPDGRGIVEALKKQGLDEALLLEAGLAAAAR